MAPGGDGGGGGHRHRDAGLDGHLPTAIGLTDTTVYFSDFGDPSIGLTDGRIISVAKTGGATTVHATNQANPLDLALDGTTLFWTNRGGPESTTTGSVMSLDLAAPMPVPVALASSQPHPAFMPAAWSRSSSPA